MVPLVWALFIGVGVRGAAAQCSDEVHAHASCAEQPYKTSQASSADDCCQLCASEKKCLQWTFGSRKQECRLTTQREAVAIGIFTFAETCGIKTGPTPPPAPTPPPGPPAPGVANTWAVIAAGSAGYMNYRHQADACHAYQVLRKSGVPANQIILMMEDDVANSHQNKFRGQLFNRNGTGVPDVYAGCKIDYRGSVVTAKLFLSVITGDESGVPAGGKVLKSTSADRVFLNFVDHGGVGIVAFPNGGVLHVKDLSAALVTMKQKSMFNELLFYMEACESGSMFPKLTPDGKILAVTASNARESSWGWYCEPNGDKVNGKEMGTCLGDLFSIAWMEDSDVGQFGTETIGEQVQKVTARTSKSHVSVFGDKSLESEPFGGFIQTSHVAATAPTAVGEGIDARDIPLELARYKVSNAANGADQEEAYKELNKIIAAREADDSLFKSIAERVCEGREGCAAKIQNTRLSLATDDALDCHKAATSAIYEFCPRRSLNSPGGWNAYNMKYSQLLANICVDLKPELSGAIALIHDECSASGMGKDIVV